MYLQIYFNDLFITFYNITNSKFLLINIFLTYKYDNINFKNMTLHKI